MKLAIIMDPLENVDPAHDTTYVIMVEATRRGHELIHVPPAGVLFLEDAVQFRGREVQAMPRPNCPFVIGAEVLLPGDWFDAVLVRPDPPFDAGYLAMTQLLDLLPDHLFVMNNPQGLRDVNEKLGALSFPGLTPPTCVCSSVADFERFHRLHIGDLVLKPLDGHGGRGVWLARRDDPNLPAMLRSVSRDFTTRFIAQALAPGHEQGDKRILVLDGEPIGSVLRRNSTGGFTHNLASGGEAFATTLSSDDETICQHLAPWLKARGLWFVGLDVIGGRLIEINVTSPTCVQEVNQLNGVNLERLIVDFVERRVNERNNRSALTSLSHPSGPYPQATG